MVATDGSFLAIIKAQTFFASHLLDKLLERVVMIMTGGLSSRGTRDLCMVLEERL